MPTSADGVLTCEFDAARNLVLLSTDGAAWPPLGVEVTNLIYDPRATNTAKWGGVFATGGAGSEAAVTGATDGPVLPDGTKATTYMRYTVSTANTAGSPIFGVAASSEDPATVYPIGTSVPIAIYIRPSATVADARVRTNQSLNAGAGTAVSAASGVALPANVWTRITGVLVSTISADYFTAAATLIGHIMVAGQTYDVTCALATPGDTAVPDHVDGAMTGTATFNYAWTGTANASPSTKTRIAGGAADTVTVTRTADGTTVPVRGIERRRVPAGTLLSSDNEAPPDASVVYEVTGYDTDDVAFYTSSVTVDTSGAEWGLWVKAPGRPELTTRVSLVAVGDEDERTIGGSWQVPGGPNISQSSAALAQSAGMGALRTDVLVQTATPAALAALRNVVRSAPSQVLLLQTGQPEELASGYYRVAGMRKSAPPPVKSDQYAKRQVVLTLEAAQIPAGPSTGAFGPTWDDVLQAFPTWQDLANSGLTWLQLATGEGWWGG